MVTMRRFLDTWKAEAKPIVWVKSAEEILAKARPKQR